jgi:hypothetical protein
LIKYKTFSLLKIKSVAHLLVGRNRCESKKKEDKIVKAISAINKFITTINFLNARDVVNEILYLETTVRVFINS